MKTQLDKKQDLLHKVACLSSVEDVQKVTIFIAGMEAGKMVKASEDAGTTSQACAAHENKLTPPY